ncbi:MAG: sigma-54 dependent transcriptional regulator [Gemmatimonadales bacterium]
MSEARKPRILVADDQRDVLAALKLLLKSEGYSIQTATSPAEVAEFVQADDFDVLLLDLNYTRDTTSGQEGLELLPRLQAYDSDLPIVVMTAWSSIESAVEAMRRGARDYIEKPWDNERLLATLRSQVELGRAVRKAKLLEAENELLREGADAPAMIAESKAMQPVLRLIDKVGPSDANVLITGEPGTGKEVVARWLHATSGRADRPLITVNTGGLSEGVFESEMFGHVKGAFTDARSDRVGYFEVAHDGTLFLDEIGNVPMAQQAKLLRVLETGELQPVGSSKTRRVDVRILTATNAELDRSVAEGTFREDLFYRLNTVEVKLPALRERREDIPLLATHFLAASGAKYGRTDLELSSTALDAMYRHSWPGNVRELRHSIERAVLLAEGRTVNVEHLGLRQAPEGSLSLENVELDEAERILIRKALTRNRGNVSRAADDLGLSRSALYRRLKRHGLQS